MAQAKVVVSAGVRLHLNGRPYGRVKNFQFSSGTPRKALYGLDCMEPFELQPTITKCSGRVGLYRTIGDAGAEGAGFTTPFELLPREKYFSLQLVERSTDTVIFEATYCTVVDQSWSAPERGVVTGDIQFEAIEWSNELKPLLP